MVFKSNCFCLVLLGYMYFLTSHFCFAKRGLWHHSTHVCEWGEVCKKWGRDLRYFWVGLIVVFRLSASLSWTLEGVSTFFLLSKATEEPGAQSLRGNSLSGWFKCKLDPDCPAGSCCCLRGGAQLETRAGGRLFPRGLTSRAPSREWTFKGNQDNIQISSTTDLRRTDIN